jgi:hypothetical protein
MGQTLLGALVGLIVGILLAGALAIAAQSVAQDVRPDKEWTGYPTLSKAAEGKAGEPLLWQHVIIGAPFSGVEAILLGGGFGSVVGAIAAATGVILRALRQTRPG